MKVRHKKNSIHFLVSNTRSVVIKKTTFKFAEILKYLVITVNSFVEMVISMLKINILLMERWSMEN